jgi:hypothetical protein
VEVRKMTTIPEWTALSDKLGVVALDIFNTANAPVTAKGFADEKVLALTLLARTWSNRRSVMLLLREKHIVEARTIARCCYENLYWIVGLAEEGEAFVLKMRDDEMTHRKQRGQFMFDSGITLEADVEDRLRTWLRTTNRTFANAKMLNPKRVAGLSNIGRSYIFYSQLSSDAAHPSVTALNRYVVPHTADEIGGIDVNPIVNDEEIEETLELLCQAVIGVCFGVNQVLCGTEGSAQLGSLADEYVALSNCSAAKAA